MTNPLLPEHIYHIYNHANGNENLFREDENYRYFLQRYWEFIDPIAETYAYCLTPNHFHLMVKIRREDEISEYYKLSKNHSGLQDLSGFISKQFSNLFNAYSKAFNKRYNRRGSLFQRPMKRKEVTSDTYYTELILYLHLNPIHHNFTHDPYSWKHSSIHSIDSEMETKVARQEVLNWFGGIDNFHKAHNQKLNNLIDTLRID